MLRMLNFRYLRIFLVLFLKYFYLIKKIVVGNKGFKIWKVYFKRGGVYRVRGLFIYKINRIVCLYS